MGGNPSVVDALFLRNPVGSISMKAAKLKIGVRSQESGARRKEEEGRSQEPEEVFLQI
jgi:hypothetical protein